MKAVGLFKGMLAWLAVLGFCLPQSVLAAEVDVDQTPVVLDVALKDGGVLIGHVVDPQGVSLARVPVSVRDQVREIAVTATDQRGYFSVLGLRGGVYQIVAAEGQRTVRLWMPGTAPPSSQQLALVVAGGDTVRGQFSLGALGFWLSNPWVLAGIAGAAVAVPIAVNQSQKPASP